VKIIHGQQTTSSPDIRLVSAISQVLSPKHIEDLLGDSTKYYSLNFRIQIKKDANGTKVKSILSNDSLAYKLFPNYRDLENLNYDVLMKNKSNIILVVPFIYLNKKVKDMVITEDEYFSFIYNSFRPDKLYDKNFDKKTYDEVIILVPIFCTPTEITYD
jgi:hypothetical protein